MRESRHEIPEALKAAKRDVVERILMAPRTAARRRVHAVSAHLQHNLVGVGIGRKVVKAKALARPCVRFYVSRKLDRRLVPPEHLLPNHIDGVETDVIEVGRLRAQTPSTRKRQRPARPGCSVGFRLPTPHDDLIMAGTLGALVTRDAARFILSNNHVLANENALAPGTEIYQPGLLDHGDPATDGIARLSRFVPLTAAGPNGLDCAIAELTGPDVVQARVMSKVGRLRSDRPVDAREGMSVEKAGRGTGYTTGTVVDVSADITLGYELGDLLFTDQILIRGAGGVFSEYGDSGALVVDQDSGQATGLLIGGGPDFSVANHIDDVLSALGVTLVV